MSGVRSTVARATRSAALNSMSWVLVLALNLVATPYLVHRLTPEIFGLWVIMNGILGYLTIVDFSFRDSLVKYMSEYVAKGDTDRAVATFNSVLLLQSVLGLACSVLLVAFGRYILGWFSVPSSSAPEVWRAYLIMSVGFPVALVSGLYANLPVAMQRFGVAATVSSVSGLLTISGVVVLVALGHGLAMVMLWSIIVLLVTSAAYHAWMRRTHPWFAFQIRLDYTIIRGLLGFSFLAQLSKSASVVNDQVVRILIGSILGPAAVTYFAVPQRLINGLQALLDKVARVMFPLASQLAASNDHETLRQSYLTIAKYLCLLTLPIYLGLALYARELLTLWMGPDFAERGDYVLIFSALSSLFISWTMVPSNIAFGLGKAKINAVFSVLVAIANLTLTYFLSMSHGLAGAATALLITQVQTPLFIFMVSNAVAPGFGGELLREAYLKPLACGVVVLPVAYATKLIVEAPLPRLAMGLPAIALAFYATAVATGLVPRDILGRLRNSRQLTC